MERHREGRRLGRKFMRSDFRPTMLLIVAHLRTLHFKRNFLDLVANHCNDSEWLRGIELFPTMVTLPKLAHGQKTGLTCAFADSTDCAGYPPTSKFLDSIGQTTFATDVRGRWGSLQTGQSARRVLGKGRFTMRMLRSGWLSQTGADYASTKEAKSSGK